MLLSSIVRLHRNINLYIPIKKLQINTCRSSGPGGQSVNKSETKVQIKFNIDKADWIDDDIKENFKIVNHNRITQKGDYIIECDDYSNQYDNKKACINKIKDAINNAKMYKPTIKLSFLEKIHQEKTNEQILNYKLNRRENRRKNKKIGHLKLNDF